MLCRELEVDAANELLTQLTRLATCLTACVPLRLAAASELVQVWIISCIPALIECTALEPQLVCTIQWPKHTVVPGSKYRCHRSSDGHVLDWPGVNVVA